MNGGPLATLVDYTLRLQSLARSRAQRSVSPILTSEFDTISKFSRSIFDIARPIISCRLQKRLRHAKMLHGPTRKEDQTWKKILANVFRNIT